MRLFAAALLAGALASCAGCEQVVGPEGEIARILHQPGGERTIELGPGTLVVKSMRFDHLLVKPEGEGYTAVGTVDVEGLYRGRIAVSYLGLERVPFVRGREGWVPKTSLLPGLQDAVRLLEARLSALAARDAAALEPLVAKEWKDPRLSRDAVLAHVKDRLSEEAAPYLVERWIVRVDREGIEVLEEYRSVAEGEVPRKSQVRFGLVREDAQLRFREGLL